MTHCPAHDDGTPSMSLDEAPDGMVLFHCFAGCTQETIIDELTKRGLWKMESPNGRAKIPAPGGEGVSLPTKTDAQTQNGYTLEEYAEDKKLPINFLLELGLTEIHMPNAAVRIPFNGEDGRLIATQFIVGRGKDGKRWKRGDKPYLYGASQLRTKDDAATVVEGASDTQTLLLHGINAIGLPSATGWKEDYLPYFKHMKKVIFVIEPDAGGEAVKKSIGRSEIRHKAYLAELTKEQSDASDMYISDPAKFSERWAEVMANAKPWEEYKRETDDKNRSEAWELAKDIATHPNILELFSQQLPKVQLVGEDMNAKILFLAMVSRNLNHPVNIVVKGVSSAGKSFVVKRVLEFFSGESCEEFTSMSDKALIYSDKEYAHKMVYIMEAEGMKSEFLMYIIRTLISEGRIKYEYVFKTDQGMKTIEVIKEGPTGFIITTTQGSIHAENETRVLSLTVNDTEEQTKRIMQTLAVERSGSPDFDSWHALDVWLESGSSAVYVEPIAKVLAELMPPAATRLRRDFESLLVLIKSHALLHQKHREIDEKGRIVATLEDYAAIRDLIDSTISEGVALSVKKETRETVNAVKDLLARPLGNSFVTLRELGDHLNSVSDSSTVSRRVKVAIDSGYLNDISTTRYKQIVQGDSMPDDLTLMPTTEDVEGELEDEFLH